MYVENETILRGMSSVLTFVADLTFVVNCFLALTLILSCVYENIFIVSVNNDNQGKKKMSTSKDDYFKDAPSDVIVFCPSHGSITLTKKDFDQQKLKKQCRCPFCGKIPAKVRHGGYVKA